MQEAPDTTKTVLPDGVFFLRGWLGILVLVPLGFAVVFSGIHAPADSISCYLCSAAGAAVILTGTIWRSWAMLYVGGRKTKELVRVGTYSMSRHPLYFGTLLVGIGAGIMLQSITWTARYLGLFPLIYLPVIGVEERALRMTHPATFQEFVFAVPRRILPRFSSFDPGGRFREVHMKAQWNQAKRGLVTLAAIPAIELLQLLRSDGVLPVWWNLP
jgi:protein-S-isoprenylcysteine O-methyltransferase Ste14